jgi:hypothetical protein
VRAAAAGRPRAALFGDCAAAALVTLKSDALSWAHDPDTVWQRFNSPETLHAEAESSRGWMRPPIAWSFCASVHIAAARSPPSPGRSLDEVYRRHRGSSPAHGEGSRGSGRAASGAQQPCIELRPPAGCRWL